MFNQEPNVNQPRPLSTKACTYRQGGVTNTQSTDNASDLSQSCVSNSGGMPHGKNYGIGDLLKLLGGSKATHYNRLNPKSPYFDPRYPKPIKNGRLSIFIASEVAAYIAGRVSVRDSDP